MKKAIIVGVLSVCMLGFGLVSGYEVQQSDTERLSQIYSRIDTVYETDHAKLIQFLDSSFFLGLKFRSDAQASYYLDQIVTYTHEKLYLTMDDTNAICISNRVQYGDSVELDYTLQTTEGDYITLPYGSVADTDTTQGIVFNAGKGQLIRGIDVEVLGKEINKDYSIRIDATHGRGKIKDSLIMNIATGPLLAKYPDAQLGSKVRTTVLVDGKKVLLRGEITAMEGENTFIDFNHPLAGKRIAGRYRIDSVFKGCR